MIAKRLPWHAAFVSLACQVVSVLAADAERFDGIVDDTVAEERILKNREVDLTEKAETVIYEYFETELTLAAQNRTKSLRVASTRGFELGETIIIDPQRDRQELNLIESLDSDNQLRLKFPLANDHHFGTVVSQAPMPKNMSFAGMAPVAVLISAVIVLILYYLGSSPTAAGQRTLHALVHVVSFFLAIMAYTGVKIGLGLAFEIKLPRRVHSHEIEYGAPGGLEGLNEKVDPDDLVNNLKLGIFCWAVYSVLATFVLTCNAHNPLRLKANGIFMGHILGFAIIDLFGGTVVHFPFFSDRAHLPLAILLYLVIVPLLTWIALKLADRIINHEDEDVEEAFTEQCVETGIEASCMGLSFLLCQYFRGLIVYIRTGQMTVRASDSQQHPVYEVLLLMLVGVIFVIPTVVFRMQRANMTRPVKIAFLCSLSLTAGWCVLDAVNWLFLYLYPGKPFFAKAVVALVWGGCFAVAVIISANTTDKGTINFRGDFMALGLAVGLSWEHVFNDALEKSSQMVGTTPSQAQLYQVLFTFLLVMVSFPLWAIRMLPQHEYHLEGEMSKEEIRALRPWQAFFDLPGDKHHADVSSESDREYESE